PRSPLTGGGILGARFRRHGPSPRLGVVRQRRPGQSRLRSVLSNHEWKRQHVTLHADRHASVTACCLSGRAREGAGTRLRCEWEYLDLELWEQQPLCVPTRKSASRCEFSAI